jgi:hypothetical protein
MRLLLVHDACVRERVVKCTFRAIRMRFRRAWNDSSCVRCQDPRFNHGDG